MFHERIALGLPSLAGYSLPEALDKAGVLGFQSVMSLPDGPRAAHSLGPFPTLGFYRSSDERRRETALALSHFRHVAVHQAWDDRWRDWIECAVWAGAATVTVHSGRPREGESSSAFVAERSAVLRRMGDYAAERGVRLGIENEGGTRQDYLELIASVDHPSVGATLDVGHCAYFRSCTAVDDPDERVHRLNEIILTMVRSLGDKLFALHVHDVRRSDWRDHRRVGSGVIDFPAVFAELRQVRFTGLMEIELEEPEREAAAFRTGEYLTALCFP